MHLKYYDGDAEDLCLTMCINEDRFGTSVEIPLIPNGENIAVTNDNKLLYIMRYANYMLNQRTQM